MVWSVDCNLESCVPLYFLKQTEEWKEHQSSQTYSEQESTIETVIIEIVGKKWLIFYHMTGNSFVKHPFEGKPFLKQRRDSQDCVRIFTFSCLFVYVFQKPLTTSSNSVPFSTQHGESLNAHVYL